MNQSLVDQRARPIGAVADPTAGVPVFDVAMWTPDRAPCCCTPATRTRRFDSLPPGWCGETPALPRTQGLGCEGGGPRACSLVRPWNEMLSDESVSTGVSRTPAWITGRTCPEDRRAVASDSSLSRPSLPLTRLGGHRDSLALIGATATGRPRFCNRPVRSLRPLHRSVVIVGSRHRRNPLSSDFFVPLDRLVVSDAQIGGIGRYGPPGWCSSG